MFSGVKYIEYKKYKEYNNCEDFLIYLISIDKKNVKSFNELLTNKAIIDFENNMIQWKKV